MGLTKPLGLPGLACGFFVSGKTAFNRQLFRAETCETFIHTNGQMCFFDQTKIGRRTPAMFFFFVLEVYTTWFQDRWRASHSHFDVWWKSWPGSILNPPKLGVAGDRHRSWNQMVEIPLKILWMEEIPNNHLGCFWNPINNGLNYQPQLVSAGFLNHQQYLRSAGLSDVNPRNIQSRVAPCVQSQPGLSCWMPFFELLSVFSVVFLGPRNSYKNM